MKVLSIFVFAFTFIANVESYRLQRGDDVYLPRPQLSPNQLVYMPEEQGDVPPLVWDRRGFDEDFELEENEEKIGKRSAPAGFRYKPRYRTTSFGQGERNPVTGGFPYHW